jgi:hypothetical protein
VFEALTNLVASLFTRRSTVLATWLAIGGSLFAAGLLGYGVYTRSLTPFRAAYLVLLILFLTLSFILFVHGMESEERLSIESNWGGLGGGLGGWRVSSSLVFLLTTAALFALLVSAFAVPEADLWERYRSSMNMAHQRGIQFQRRAIVGNKLYLKGAAATQADANAFWDQVKLANPDHDDIEIELAIGPQRPGSAPSASNEPSPLVK